MFAAKGNWFRIRDHAEPELKNQAQGPFGLPSLAIHLTSSLHKKRRLTTQAMKTGFLRKQGRCESVDTVKVQKYCGRWCCTSDDNHKQCHVSTRAFLNHIQMLLPPNSRYVIVSN